jgi:hypothetical protein
MAENMDVVRREDMMSVMGQLGMVPPPLAT